ncbi:unnamed protein product [Gemmata massiliana]|uniref:Magnesium transporter MgtE intracellular domain-containing protein n=1 Tax=Gemmata massiliana TaxID=1210884 RepID=A0A6P2D500_9BACT|nr:hypothetical protein [Gemmata massiliana]VTR96368.1 unnamed protein product [Gemmata massiliana]
MKNLIFLGAIALLLFSLSAALSLWLNQSRQQQETAEKDKAEKEKAEKPTLKPGPSGDPSKDPAEPKTIPKTPPANLGPDVRTVEPQEKLERKALQISLVLQDVQAQREATDALLRQVTTELKTATKNPEPDPKVVEDLKKRQAEDRANEIKNYEKLAAVYDAMTPEGAAPILKQMAESGTGKMEQTAQILVRMKERNTARLMEALGDPALAAQLMDKVRQLKALNAALAAPGAAPAPAPGGAAPGRPLQ